MIQWLELGALTAEAVGSLPGQETEIPQLCKAKKKKKKKLSGLAHDGGQTFPKF